MSRHARAALQCDIDALDLLWREHQDIRRRFRDHDEMVPQAADFDACVAQLAACLLPHLDAERQELFPRLRRSARALGGLGLQFAARRRALQVYFSRQSMLRTTRWAAARLAA
jgi:Hemerythrin HHE cation binding domain